MLHKFIYIYKLIYIYKNLITIIFIKVLTMNRKFFDIVVATCKNNSKYGIGLKNDLPWKSKKDLNFFKEITTNNFFTNKYEYDNTNKMNILIMGRKTYDSIPENFKPFSKRINCVISRSMFENKNIDYIWKNRQLAYFSSLDNCLDYINKNKCEEQLEGNCYLIGGAELYKIGFQHPDLRYIFNNEIKEHFECDTFVDFDPIKYNKIYESPIVNDTNLSFSTNVYQKLNGVENKDFKLSNRMNNFFTSDNNKFTNQYDSITRTNVLNAVTNMRYYSTNNNNYLYTTNSISNLHPEYQYLNLLSDILTNGIVRTDRTNVGTISVFGRQLRFNNINKKFPLLTTKKVYWKGVAEELLWFLRADTNANNLKDKKVHIWDGNTSREYLDSVGLNHYEEGECGPFYGFQWRHFGADYKTMHDDYTGKGIDQVKRVIDTIKTNPYSRRLIVSAWNPTVLDKMCLNPCHVMYQFYCNPDKKEISVHMYQRSADVFLGLPFNIASTATFLSLIGYLTDYTPKDVIVSIGDTHIYSNHVEQCKTQIERTPYEWCKLFIDDNGLKIENIEDFNYTNLKLLDYKSHPTIKAEMAV